MTLIEEIQAKCDPALLVHPRNDYAIWQVVNVGRTRSGPVSRNSFAIWCGETGLRAVIEDVATDKASPLRSIALLCKDVLAGGPDILDFSVAGNVAMLQAWVAAGAITQQQADALVALGAVPDQVTLDEIGRVLNAANIGMPPEN